MVADSLLHCVLSSAIDLRWSLIVSSTVFCLLLLISELMIEVGLGFEVQLACWYTIEVSVTRSGEICHTAPPMTTIFIPGLFVFSSSGNSVILRLAKNDQVYIQTADQTDLYGATSEVYGTFSGYLIAAVNEDFPVVG